MDRREQILWATLNLATQYPDIEVLKKLGKSKTRAELWENLPTVLEYNKHC